MAQQNSVYDPDADKHPVHNQLHSDSEGGFFHNDADVDAEPETDLPEDGGDTSSERSDKGSLKKAEEKGGFFNPHDDSSQADKSSLKSSESNGGLGDDDGLFNPGSEKKNGKLSSFGRKHWKKLFWGVGSSAGIGGLLISLLLSLSPLKIESFTTNLQSRFFASSEQAMENGSDNLLSGYIVKHVLPDYKNCGTTRSLKCKPKTFANGNNPVTNLYRGWADARLENVLANKYKIEFKYDTAKKAWYLKAPDGPISGDNIGPNGEGLTHEFERADRAGMRGAIQGAMEKETLSKRIMYRYKVGRLLEQKYGIKRCIIFCGTRDALGDKTESKKRAAKLYLAERVLQPRSEMTFIAVRCLLDDTCDPNKTTVDADGDPASNETGGEPVSEVETEGRSKLAELAGQYGVHDADALEKIHSDISEKGFTSYLIEKSLVKIFGVEAGKAAAMKVADAIPVVGWIDLASTIIHTADNAGPKVKKLSYITNAAAAVSAYSMYRTYADEVHTGNVDSTEVGSMVDSFGEGVKDDKDPLVGGAAAADGSPLYSSIMNNQGATTVASVFTPGSASAASTTNNPDYECNDGKPVPSGKLVCSEEMLGQGSNTLDAVHDFLNMPGMNVITTIASAWQATFHKIFTFAGDAVGFVLSPALDALDASCSIGIGPIHLGDAVAGYCHVKPLVEDGASKILKALISAVIPNPFGSNMGGGRNFDMVAQGAYVSGKDACNQMGCQTVDTSVAMQIVNEREAEARHEFEQRPLFARMFSTDTPYSLASTIAVSMPSTGQSILQSVSASITTNPITALSNSFATMFRGPKVAAASGEAVDPFHGGTVAFPKNKIPKDMEKYWDEHNCGDESDNGPIAKWQQAAADAPVDPNTGMPVHSDVEPCLLIKNVAGDVGAKYDSSLLSEDERQVYAGGTAAAATSTAGADVDVAHLFEDSTSVACAPNTKDLGTQDGYTQGKKVKIRICAVSNLPSTGEESQGNYGVPATASGKAVVNSRVSGAVYAMVEAAKKDGVDLAASSAFRTMAHQRALCPCDGVTVAIPGTSNHQMGIAIDFAGGLTRSPGPIPGNKFWEWLSKNADKFGYKNYPRESWHWSPTGS